MQRIMKIVASLALLTCSQQLHANSAAAVSPKPITFPHTITTPGTYKLTNDISGQVVIGTDGVNLHLNNYTISGTAHGVVVNAGVKHAKIEGGKIGPITAGNGIEIGTGSSEIIIQKITA